MTEFFQTYEVIGEDTTWSEEQTGEEKIKNVPEIEIDVHDFLLITDPELKAKHRSDNRSESRYPEVGLSTEIQIINTSTVSVNYSSSTTTQPIQTEKAISSSTSSSTSPPVPSASTPDNVLLSSTSSASVESLTSDSLISTSTSSLVSCCYSSK